MSILIKGMEMPKNCALCKLRGAGETWCPFTLREVPGNTILEDCPLIPVPPHGRLIDADELHSALRKRAKEFSDSEYGEGVKCGLADAREYIKKAPTIIFAEEKEENFCADCHWYEAEEQYCFRNGCHAYNESTCEHWEPMPADEPIPAPGGKTAPTTYDLLYEEGGAGTT